MFTWFYCPARCKDGIDRKAPNNVVPAAVPPRHGYCSNQAQIGMLGRREDFYLLISLPINLIVFSQNTHHAKKLFLKASMKTEDPKNEFFFVRL